LYSHYASQKVDVILVPSAFLVKTGEAHWEILLRARAIESQTYVVAAAQGGTHLSTKGPAQRETFGHSLVIDPWGKVVAEAKQDDSVMVVELKKENIEKMRKQIPMSAHRRLGLQRENK
jgi:predicted amidohydrolase